MLCKSKNLFIWKQLNFNAVCKAHTTSVVAGGQRAISPGTDPRFTSHIPVLKQEVVKLLQPENGKTFIDMTLGGGGLSAALLESCSNIRIIGLDRDRTALKYGKVLQNQYGRDRIKLFHGKFTDLPELLTDTFSTSNTLVDGIVFDVGLSTMQFDDRRRGFALKTKGPLDMRMNSDEDTPTAADVLNKLDEKDLRKILKKYGQEPQARLIARQIVEHRQMMGPIQTTRQLQDVVADVYRKVDTDDRRDKIGRKRHPATLTFQALRIFVNDELNQLYNGLKVAHRLLKPMGICAAITFHSLEHNIVHQVFNTSAIIAKQNLVTPDLGRQHILFPWKCDRIVIKPSAEEVALNPKSRSAELRVAYKKNTYQQHNDD